MIFLEEPDSYIYNNQDLVESRATFRSRPTPTLPLFSPSFSFVIGYVMKGWGDKVEV